MHLHHTIPESSHMPIEEREPMPYVSEHTKADGWPFDPGQLVRVYFNGGWTLGRYLRLDLNSAESCWGDEPAREGFNQAFEEQWDDCHDCGAELDIELNQEEWQDCPECGSNLDPLVHADTMTALNYNRSYGIQARVALSQDWPNRHGGKFFVLRPLCDVQAVEDES